MGECGRVGVGGADNAAGPATRKRAWRRPSHADPWVVDAVEAAWQVPGVAVLLRGTLGRTTVVSSGAWEAFLDAVKRGEFDRLPTAF